LYKCGGRSIGELIWEFVTEGDQTGALGPLGTAKSGGTVKPAQNAFGCLIDTREVKHHDYPRVALFSHLKQALAREGIKSTQQICQKWPFFSGECKVTVSSVALYVAGRKPSFDSDEASHRCHAMQSCVLATADDDTTHLLWESSAVNLSRKGCGQVVPCGSCNDLVDVCRAGKLHSPPCFPRHAVVR
jgi:hypothetical protein